MPYVQSSLARIHAANSTAAVRVNNSSGGGDAGTALGATKMERNVVIAIIVVIVVVVAAVVALAVVLGVRSAKAKKAAAATTTAAQAPAQTQAARQLLAGGLGNPQAPNVIPGPLVGFQNTGVPTATLPGKLGAPPGMQQQRQPTEPLPLPPQPSPVLVTAGTPPPNPTFPTPPPPMPTPTPTPTPMPTPAFVPTPTPTPTPTPYAGMPDMRYFGVPPSHAAPQPYAPVAMDVPLIGPSFEALDPTLRAYAMDYAQRANVSLQAAAAIVVAQAQGSAQGQAHVLGAEPMMPTSDRPKSVESRTSWDSISRAAQDLVTTGLDASIAQAGLAGRGPIPTGVGRIGNTLDAAAPTAPNTATATAAEPVVSAEQAMALVGDPVNQTTVIVAMDNCPACTSLRGKLAGSMHAVRPGAVVVLKRDEWLKVKEQFPANSVPQLFKVGSGRIAMGPTGDMDVHALVAYIQA